MSSTYQIDSYSAYKKAYEASISQPEQFWGSFANQFEWYKKWDKVIDGTFGKDQVNWYKGAKLNITVNCLDRHLLTNGNKPAIIWEPNHPEDAHQIITYKQLHLRVMQFAHVLRNNGVRKGDTVAIYMGMIPELVIAMLACARVGAVHTVIFGGFSAQSISERINDAEARFIVTCDGAHRGNKTIPLKSVIDDAMLGCPQVERIIVLTHTRTPVSMRKNRDVWWEDEINKVEQQGNPFFTAEIMDADDPLFILYTSGTTNKPKGVVHATAGYLIWANYTFMNAFQYQPGQVHFSTADIGWITGHSYIVYGPLSAGAPTLLFEGIPTWPNAGRLWDIVEKFNVNILYTVPSAIRNLMSYSAQYVQNKVLDSLRVIGFVGETLDEKVWNWTNQHVGHNQIPIIDSWWQTETGGIMITNLAGLSESKPHFATYPLPGVDLALVTEDGNIIHDLETEGYLCIKSPWPGMFLKIHNDISEIRQKYYNTYEKMYFTGDGCKRDALGRYMITGRVDDVLNVNGHRIGINEIEESINMHSGVYECAVVGYNHDIKGQGIYAFIVYTGQVDDLNLVRQDIVQSIVRSIGVIAKPDKIQFVKTLPKTGSGKIAKKVLANIACGHHVSDLVASEQEVSIIEEILANRI